MPQIAKYFTKIFSIRNILQNTVNSSTSNEVKLHVTIKLSKRKYNFHVKIKGNVDCCIYLQDVTEAAVRRYSSN